MTIVKPRQIEAQYQQIERGTSLRIPIIVKYQDETPLDLTGFLVYFTLKEPTSDYDYHDARAFIKIDLAPQYPREGRFNIDLSSKHTYIPPGDYWFDVELMDPMGGIARLCRLKTKIVGGPTNRPVNDSTDPIIIGDQIQYILTEAQPILVITPLAVDPTSGIVKTLTVKPSWLEDDLYTPTNPVLKHDNLQYSWFDKIQWATTETFKFLEYPLTIQTQNNTLKIEFTDLIDAEGIYIDPLNNISEFSNTPLFKTISFGNVAQRAQIYAFGTNQTRMFVELIYWYDAQNTPYNMIIKAQVFNYND